MRIANAPVSVGVYGPETPVDAAAFLASMVAQGYAGVDLGPGGWLAGPDRIRSVLDTHRLDLAGGWVDLPFQDDDGYRAARPALDAALALFVAARGDDPAWWPKPTLAVTSTPERERVPGGAAPGLGLSAGGWRRLAANVADAADRCREHGLEPTFHHHACTFVETPDEIERLLELTDVMLTLDTGHLLVGGGDPVAAPARWAGRINHVHLKDVRLEAFRDAVASGDGMHEVWARNLFCRLGDGALDLDGVLAALASTGYHGWAVVEQDVVLPDVEPGETYDTAVADQAANLERLVSAGVAGAWHG